MTSPEARAGQFRELVLPLSLVLALALQCVYLGRRSQHWDDAADAIVALRAENGSLKQRLDGVDREADRRQFLQDQTNKSLREDLDALKVFAHGRIDQLPWHTPRYLR